MTDSGYGEGVRSESREEEPEVAARIIPGDEVTVSSSQER